MFLINNLVDPLVKLFNAQWMSEINFASVILRILIATLFGGFIGVERAVKRHAAGLRTYILVSVGATTVMMTNQFLMNMFNMGDAARLGAQVISGIGFLGAGTIIVNSRNQIKGLTTAAALWACACTGLALGIGFYTIAIVSFFVIIVSLMLLPAIESFFLKKGDTYEIQVEFKEKAALVEFVDFIRSKGIRIALMDPNTQYEGTGLFVCTFMFDISKVEDKKYKNHKEILNEISELSYVHHVDEIM